MKRGLLALLKLLLQLVIFSLTGSWPRFAESPADRPAKPSKKPPGKKKNKQPKSAGRPGLFQPVPSKGTVRRATVYGEVEPSLEEQLGRQEGGVPVRRRRALERPSRSSTHMHASLGNALRSPTVIRDAVALGAALGPRRARR